MAAPAGSTIDKLLERFVQEEGVPGAALAVAQGQRVVHECYRGRAAGDTPASAATLWPLASISKLYTAATIMRLIETGVLTLGTRVQQVLPTFERDGRDKITLRQLLTHTSGLIYESPRMQEMMAARRPYDELIADAYSEPLLYRPGTNQHYSDFGYAIAARVASAVTGRSFPELVREWVLDPAGLTGTFMPPPRDVAARVAHVTGAFAEGTDGAMYNSTYARDLAHPAFGTVATVRDLLAFGLLYARNPPIRLHSRAGATAMTIDQTGGDFPGEMVIVPEGVIHPWGIGFMIKGAAGSPQLVSPASFGHMGASGCILWIDPAADLTVAFASNLHVNTGMDAWQSRIDRVVNVVMAELGEDR